MNPELVPLLEKCLKTQRQVHSVPGALLGIGGLAFIAVGIFVPAKTPSDAKAKVGMMVFAVALIAFCVRSFIVGKNLNVRTRALFANPQQVKAVQHVTVIRGPSRTFAFDFDVGEKKPVRLPVQTAQWFEAMKPLVAGHFAKPKA